MDERKEGGRKEEGRKKEGGRKETRRGEGGEGGEGGERQRVCVCVCVRVYVEGLCTGGCSSRCSDGTEVGVTLAEDIQIIIYFEEKRARQRSGAMLAVG